MTSPPDHPPLAARRASATERAAFLALARQCGAHGVYAGNDLAADSTGRMLAARGLGVYAREGPAGLCWFGTRGNLLVMLAHAAGSTAHAIARAIAASELDWRIALGPEPVLGALTRFLSERPAVYRRQLYYAADPTAIAGVREDPRVRAAVPQDLESLMAASLALNQADLHVDPSRVSDRWLRQSTRERVRSQAAWVIGPVGAPFAKLDVGSEGPAGAVIEGVFTVPEHRGKGHARALVHAVASRLLAAGRSLVCLHVAADNVAAVRCYARAGLRETQAVHLLLRDG